MIGFIILAVVVIGAFGWLLAAIAASSDKRYEEMGR